MKTLFFTVAIAATAALYGIGFFVPQSPDTAEGLVVLSDTEMAQRAGGKWMQQQSSNGSGSRASCSVSDCPDGTYDYTNPRYRCVPCTSSQALAYTSKYVPKVTRSWCDDFGVEGIRCDYESYTWSWWSSCENYQGRC